MVAILFKPLYANIHIYTNMSLQQQYTNKADLRDLKAVTGL